MTSNVEALTEKIEKSDQLWVGDKLWRGEETTIRQFPDYLSDARFFRMPKTFGYNKNTVLTASACPLSIVYIAWKGKDGFTGLNDENPSQDWVKASGSIYYDRKEHKGREILRKMEKTDPELGNIWQRTFGASETVMVLPSPTGNKSPFDIKVAIFIVEPQPTSLN